MDENYDLTTKVLIHLALSVLDIGISAAAGAAASATGAHVEGVKTTAKILQLGALGGLIKSGILNAAVLMMMLATNIFVTMLVVFVGSTFGTAVLITLAITQDLFRDTPNALLIAAAAAGAPMIAGTFALQASGPVSSIQSIGWDALVGYTFARVAENHGYHVCEYKSAAAAGAVFGTLVWFMKLPISLYFSARAKEEQSHSYSYQMTSW